MYVACFFPVANNLDKIQKIAEILKEEIEPALTK